MQRLPEVWLFFAEIGYSFFSIWQSWQRLPPTNANSMWRSRMPKVAQKQTPNHIFHHWYSQPKWAMKVTVAKMTKTFTVGKLGQKCQQNQKLSPM